MIPEAITTTDLLASLRPVDRVSEKIAELKGLESSVVTVDGNVAE